MPSARPAFTLIEMLVVITIIATLAGLLIPTVSLVKRMANDLKCSNNLQQVAGALNIYGHEHEDALPDHLYDLVERGGLLSGMKKLLLCPRDASRGIDKEMGRLGLGDSKAFLYDDQRDTLPQTDENYRATPDIVPCSYLYETCGYVASDCSYFLNNDDYIKQTQSKGEPPIPEPLTYFKLKQWQLNKGTPDSSNTEYSGPFNPSLFPIIRCWHHFSWAQNVRAPKVHNVSWDMNIFNGQPQWEIDADPRFDFRQ